MQYREYTLRQGKIAMPRTKIGSQVINFNRLKGFGIQHDMVLIYPKTWDDEVGYLWWRVMLGC